MLRTLFVAVFLTLYALIVGPPLILYAWITKDPDPVYWAGVKGVMFFVRSVACAYACWGWSVSLLGFAYSWRITPVRRMRRQWWARFRGGLRSF